MGAREAEGGPGGRELHCDAVAPLTTAEPSVRPAKLRPSKPRPPGLRSRPVEQECVVRWAAATAGLMTAEKTAADYGAPRAGWSNEEVRLT